MAFVNTAEHFSSKNPELTMPSGSRDRPMTEVSPVYSSFYPRSTLYGVPFTDEATTIAPTDPAPPPPVKECINGTVLNTTTGECESPTVPVPPVKECFNGTVLNTTTGECESPTVPVPPVKECFNGTVLNTTTGECESQTVPKTPTECTPKAYEVVDGGLYYTLNDQNECELSECSPGFTKVDTICKANGPTDSDGFVSKDYIKYGTYTYRVDVDNISSIHVKTIIPQERVYNGTSIDPPSMRHKVSLFKKLARHQSGVVKVRIVYKNGTTKWLTNDKGKTPAELEAMPEKDFPRNDTFLVACYSPELVEKEGNLGGLYLEYSPRFNPEGFVDIGKLVNIFYPSQTSDRSYENLGDESENLILESGYKLPMDSKIAFHTATCRGSIPDTPGIAANPIGGYIFGTDVKFLGYGPVSKFLNESQISRMDTRRRTDFKCNNYLWLSATQPRQGNPNEQIETLHMLKKIDSCFENGVLGDTGKDGSTEFYADKAYNITDDVEILSVLSRMQFC